LSRLKIEYMNVNDLIPYINNPRINDKAVDKVAASIKEFGWTNPILVSKDGYILAGHARLKAAKKAGLEEVPVIYLPLEGAKAEAYMIADNRLQEETKWDNEILEDLMKDLSMLDFDLELTGFDKGEIDDILDDLLLVVDPFLGAGTTIIAAEKSNRKAYGIELDETYCELTIQRWEEYTGKKAEKVV